jgi:prophage regulatory protein
MSAKKKGGRVLRLAAVIAKVSLKRDAIYRLGRARRFPRPIKLGERASGWLEDEIDDWLDARGRERDDKVPTP